MNFTAVVVETRLVDLFFIGAFSMTKVRESFNAASLVAELAPNIKAAIAYRHG
jgi:hypothetical protein